MARLINADELQKQYATKIGEWRGNGLLPSMECLMWIAAQDMLEAAPTIPAIPMEFLERRREGLIFAAMTGSQVYGDNSIELCHAINMVLNMWQEEQEARDG